MLYNKNQDIIQQGLGGYTSRIRRLYNKDQEVISRIFDIGATIHIGREMLRLLYAGFFVSGFVQFNALSCIALHCNALI